MDDKHDKHDKHNNFDVRSYISKSVSDLLDADSKKDEEIDTLVLSGGSMKGMAQLGAMHYLEERNILQHIKHFAGTSAGSLICALLVIEYRPVEIYRFFMNIDASKMFKINAYNLFSKLGLDDGQRFEIVIKKFFKAKSIDPGITFSELYVKTQKTLIVTGSCINDKKVYYFSHDTHPHMKVVDALRISISVPIFYTPRKYKGKVFLDGGCIDNYPMALFQHKLQKVIGIYVSEHRAHVDKINSIESFLLNTIGCIREGMDINARKGFEDRTIYIKCTAGEDNNHISTMFDQGYVTAAEFFA